MLVNLIIFRIPDEDGQKIFTEIPYDQESKCLGLDGPTFTVDDDDNYNQMEFYHLVLAQRTEKGSVDLLRVAISDKDNKDEVVYKLQKCVIEECVNTVIEGHSKDN